jgi:hypothetical protein
MRKNPFARIRIGGPLAQQRHPRQSPPALTALTTLRSGRMRRQGRRERRRVRHAVVVRILCQNERVAAQLQCA